MQQTYEMDSAPLLRSASQQYLEFGSVVDQLALQEPEAQLASGASEEDLRAAMSVGLREQLQAYVDAHPSGTLRLQRYTRTVDDHLAAALDTGQPAPDQSTLVHITSSSSAADVDGMSVTAEVLVAARSVIDIVIDDGLGLPDSPPPKDYPETTTPGPLPDAPTEVM